MALDLLEQPPCPRCSGETKPCDDLDIGVAPDTRRCYVCGAVFLPRRAVIDGPAGHWWAYSERFGELLCKPMSKGDRDDEPPPHPDSLPGDEYVDQEWGESEVSAPATRVALVLLLGRDPRRDPILAAVS